MTSHGAVVKSSLLHGIVIFHALIRVEIVQSVPLTSSENGDGSTAATLSDIKIAIKTITNDTEEIDYLIPNMFNLSATEPTYVFRFPQAEETTNQSVVTMKRSEFMQPIFPNLTESYIQLMKGKEINSQDDDKTVPDQDETINDSLEEETLDAESNSTLVLNLQTERNFIEYVNVLNGQDEDTTSNIQENNDDEWSMLGLHGWKGTLSKPHIADRPISSGNTKQEVSNTTLKWDLPGKMIDDKFEHNVMQIMTNSNVYQNVSQAKIPITNMRADHWDADVYISRANDPFGHSTKWYMKNSSHNLQDDERKKRAVLELYSMIKCSTGCDPIVFKGYGCYCGFLGNGHAVDGIDRCCKQHDKCYEGTNCISYLEYFVPYLWKCYRGKPLCAIDHGEWGGPGSCAARLCECDLSLSRCLRKFVCPQKRAICRTSKSRMIQNILFNF